MTGFPEFSDAHLVVVDAQNIFADPGSEWGSEFFPAAMENITALAGRFPHATTFTRWVPMPANLRSETSWEPYFQTWSFADVPATDWLYDLVPAAQELADTVLGAAVIDATTFGKWGAPLRQRAGETPHLLLTGVSTDCCVLSTALAAVDAGAFVTVVTDACAASSAEAGAATEAVMELYAPQLRLVTTAQVLDALDG